MSSNLFDVKEHIIPAQYVREYPRATSHSQEETLYLHIKQYRPLENLDPKPGDITLIGSHSNAFIKETLEPVWDDILERCKKNGVGIRSIWVADVANQGGSGVLNEQTLGDEPSWDDHARDLLHMINHCRSDIRRPLVGIGHSMGATHLVHLSAIHPRLLSGLILVEPIIHPAHSDPFSVSLNQACSHRTAYWPSRTAATAAIHKNPFYTQWDRRVVNNWLKYCLRDTPSLLYPDGRLTDQGEQPVVLTTPPLQEVAVYLRQNFHPEGHVDRTMHPDLDSTHPEAYPFYRPEPPRHWTNSLPSLRPPTLYILGSASPSSSVPGYRQELLARTGSAVGGSGGLKLGKVAELVVPGTGHAVMMEEVAAVADGAVEWLSKVKRWYNAEEEDVEMKKWRAKSQVEKFTVSEEWKKQAIAEWGRRVKAGLQVDEEWRRMLGGQPFRGLEGITAEGVVIKSKL
ncbi:MAG: hypothetical protein M1819_001173 [Sarea resinae]|nr:MAG: hypothetical protein M1819_001173 [Sarea resinae]